jgi:hypothetical protein
MQVMGSGSSDSHDLAGHEMYATCVRGDFVSDATNRDKIHCTDPSLAIR